MEKKTVYVLLGPTGSGKTGLLWHLNPDLFEIVSCDSRQIYREMPIGTAAPDEDIKQRITHHIIECIRPDESMDASRYAELARNSIADIFERGKIPFIAGGTGFYYMSLKTNMFQAPADPEIREYLFRLGRENRKNMLLEKDPSVLVASGESARAGRIHPHDDYRITRALEVILTTGKTWTEHWRNRLAENFATEYDFTGWFIEVELEDYRRRVETRAKQMVDMGMVDEAEFIFNKYGRDSQGLKSLGYSDALDVLSGKISREEFAVILGGLHYQYGRKQRTWFKREKELAGVRAENLPAILENLSSH